MTATIFYDGDCPFCSAYVRYLRLKETVGTPVLVDLRRDAKARADLQGEGFDLDGGMVVDIDGRRHFGDDAIHALSMLAGPSGTVNRLCAAVFRSPRMAALLYPFMRAGRNAWLTFSGRAPIGTDESGWDALFTVFSLVFGLFAVLHFFVYAFAFSVLDVYATTWLILALGTALFLFPGSRRIFLLLIGTMVVDAWLHAPMQSNHTILKNFLLLTFLLAGIWHVMKGSRWSAFFRDVVPVGRVLLLVMYFYGVFHKINEGFLDPTVSCAVALWQVMPWPLHLIDHLAVQYLAIYGTFVVETVIAVMLIVPRLRNWGIVLGIGFHGLLGFSAFAAYIAFSTLTVALHVLFISPDQAKRIVAGRNYRALTRHMRSWQGLCLLALWMPAIGWLTLVDDHNMAALVWLMLAVPVFAILLFHGAPAVAARPGHARAGEGVMLWSRLGWLNLVGVLFFLNCAMPYLGLKTAQSMNMFANLRIEGGVNNHLVMKWMPAPFAYTHDLVELRSQNGRTVEEPRLGGAMGTVYYQLLSDLERAPDGKVSFVRNGVLHEDQSASTLAADIDATLHPAWMRKWFHFQRVPLSQPTPCW